MSSRGGLRADEDLSNHINMSRRYWLLGQIFTVNFRHYQIILNYCERNVYSGMMVAIFME